MSSDQTGAISGHGSGPHGRLPTLALGALGVVFGDIGTSPLYARKESFVGHHPLAVDHAHIFGVLSLIFWTMTLMALLALIGRSLGEARWTPVIAMLGVIATALFYGDAIITPAISVLSAVEGLTVVETSLGELVLPIAIVILLGLFLIARALAKPELSTRRPIEIT